MNIFTLEQLNRQALENPKQLILECERDFSDRIQEIVNRIQGDGVRYVFISGPTSSGKTTFSKKFVALLGGAHHIDISLDDYYKPMEEMPRRKSGGYNFESMNSLNLQYMYKSFRLLKEGKEVYLPLVDFMSQKRIENHEKIKRQPDSVVVVEGLHALNSKITGIFEGEPILKVFIFPTPVIQAEGRKVSQFDFRFIRRMVRDYHYRNADVKRSLAMWQDVRGGEKIYMASYQKNADFILNTFLPYEPCILKQPALSLLEGVEGESGFDLKLARLKNLLALFCDIPLSLLPHESLLNEFVKKD